jgi:hypothetical protein
MFYANECRGPNVVVSAGPDSHRFAGRLAWDFLHGMGHFPSGMPLTRPLVSSGMAVLIGSRGADLREQVSG